MKLSSSLSILALAAATTAVAQTSAPSSTTTPAHPHHAAASSTLSKNIPPVHGLLHTAYSLKYIDTKIGTGELATTKKFYTVKYTGWLASNGTKFDSSYDHPGAEPIVFPVGAHRVIPGWDTGFAGMHIGGKRRLFIPYQLAYGELGRPPVIPPKSNLIFDIELVSMSDKPPAPKPPMTPPPSATPPAASTPPPASAPATPPPTSAPATPPATPPATTTPPANPPTPPPSAPHN